VEAIEGFLAAHQMAIAQLSIAYCDTLVEDSVKRATFFGFVDAASGDAFFTSPVAGAFGSGDSLAKNQVVDALFDRVSGLPGSGSALANAPSLAEIKDELIGPSVSYPDNLYDRLENNCANDTDCQPDAARTRAIVKAMCSSMLGSATALVQ
jgi:hypothetical protein